MKVRGSYPWKIPSCQEDKFWFFIGDDGKEYSNCNGDPNYAMLNIGYRNPQLKTLARKYGNGTLGRPVDLDEFFSNWNVTRPTE